MEFYKLGIYVEICMEISKISKIKLNKHLICILNVIFNNIVKYRKTELCNSTE